MSKGILIILLLIAASLLILNYTNKPKEFVKNQTFVVTSDLLFIYETTKYPSKVQIIESGKTNLTLGLVTDPWNLDFGIIPKGGYSTRHVDLNNNEKNKVRVYFEVYGDIKPLVSFSKNNFILNPNEAVRIDIFLKTNETKIGNYYGEIDVIIKKARYEYSLSLL
jgi:hypothetical protein